RQAGLRTASRRRCGGGGAGPGDLGGLGNARRGRRRRAGAYRAAPVRDRRLPDDPRRHPAGGPTVGGALMTLSDSDFGYVSGLVRRESAIVLTPGKEYLVEARLLPVARQAGAASVAEFLGIL